MDWTAPVDIYCERLGPGLLAEPLNAVTNLSFFVAAMVGLIAARRRGRVDAEAALLIGLTLALGTGSTLFHTFAQRWAGAADVIPILLFILAYLFVALRRFFAAPAADAAALTLAFLFFASGLRDAAGGALPGGFAPALGYLPALVALLVCGLLLALRGHGAGGWLIAAAGLFAVSLTFRSLDQRLCGLWPIGTHFLWHLLNGAVLGTLLVAHARHRARRVAAGAAAG